MGRHSEQQTLPGWVTVVVVLTLLAAFVYNLVIYGPKGYPMAVIIGGLLGAYGGLRELLNRRSGGGDDK